MKLIFRFMKKYSGSISAAVLVKFFSTVSELSLPYILEHIIDHIVPLKDLNQVLLWGGFMFVMALITWGGNALANRLAVKNAHNVSYDIRQALFEKTMYLNGKQFDAFGLPSLISRMTSDSYNVQTASQQLQTISIRAPMLLIGGLCMMLLMDVQLSLILIASFPLLFSIIFLISSRGIPLFHKVQEKLDNVVRIMRENITGIRVVKALSKVPYEMNRFKNANDELRDSDVRAGITMALPSPLIQLILNIGLCVVVFIGAKRVDAGLIDPGVILAFLTYFNMITMGVMAINRIFVSMSKASASANRMGEVIDTETGQDVIPEEACATPSGDGFIRFEHVTFSYSAESTHENRLHGPENDTAFSGEDGECPEEHPGEADARFAGGQHENAETDDRFAGGARENALKDISFTLKKGESLGIIGPTGCGKTTIINLLMHFYDATEGAVFVDGKDVRGYDKAELRSRFGTVFQNDMIFKDTLRGNIGFDRDVSDDEIREAADDAQVLNYIETLEEGFGYEASIQGANLSGGQKQRILVARALAGKPEILVLDDSSSALDYKTDALMRKAIAEHLQDTTMILIAQRVSSVMNMTHIMVMEEGSCKGYGTHAELLKTCPAYKEIYDIQMGAMNE